MWSGNYPNLATGQRQKSTKIYKSSYLYIWRPAETYCLNMEISEKKKKKNWLIWASFFPQKNPFFLFTLGLSPQKKKKSDW
jgi:hypothetical protein